MKKAIRIKSTNKVLKIVPPKGYVIKRVALIDSNSAMALDDAQWITVGSKTKKDGSSGGGRHCLIDKDTGMILGGFGKGKTLKEHFGGLKKNKQKESNQGLPSKEEMLKKFSPKEQELMRKAEETYKQSQTPKSKLKSVQEKVKENYSEIDKQKKIIKSLEKEGNKSINLLDAKAVRERETARIKLEEARDKLRGLEQRQKSYNQELQQVEQKFRPANDPEVNQSESKKTEDRYKEQEKLRDMEEQVRSNYQKLRELGDQEWELRKIVEKKSPKPNQADIDKHNELKKEINDLEKKDKSLREERTKIYNEYFDKVLPYYDFKTDKASNDFNSAIENIADSETKEILKNRFNELSKIREERTKDGIHRDANITNIKHADGSYNFMTSRMQKLADAVKNNDQEVIGKLVQSERVEKQRQAQETERENKRKEIQRQAGINTSDLSLERATSAYRLTSSAPERIGQSDINDYKEKMTDLYSDLVDKAKTPEQKAILDTEFAKLQSRYKSALNDYWGSHSNVASTLITGRGGFNGVRNQKKMEASMNKLERLNEIYDNGYKQISKKLNEQNKQEYRQSTGREPFIGQKIEQIKHSSFPQTKKAELYSHVLARAAKGDTEYVNKALQDIKKAGVFTDKHKIWRLADYAQRKAGNNAQMNANNSTMRGKSYQGVNIERNTDDNRLRLRMDTIPSAEIRTELKQNGWRWSPREKAWQRTLGNNAEYSADRILSKFYKEAN